MKKYSKEASYAARSLSNFVDVEDFLKSVHEVVYPEIHAERKTSIVHKTIDWSKYPRSSFRKLSEDFSGTNEDDYEGEKEEKEEGPYEKSSDKLWWWRNYTFML